MTLQTVFILRSNLESRDPRLINEARILVSAGYHVTVISWDRERVAVPREQRDGYNIIRYQRIAPYASKRLFLVMPLWFLFIIRTVLFKHADFIHACDFDTILPSILLRFVKRTRLIYDIYDFYASKSPTIPRRLLGLFRTAEQWCARRADAVVMVDEARLYQLGDNPPKHVLVVPNYPTDRVDPSWKKRREGPFTLFYAGLIADNRGIPKLIQTTKDIPGIRVIIAGNIRDEISRQAIESATHCEYLGLIDHDRAVRLTFEADAVYSFYDPVLEINRTANSQKMFEAFMCSTAVIANNEPPSARVINEYNCGLTMPYNDDATLRKTLDAWRDDPEIPREMGRRGRQLFERELNWNTVAAKLLDTYRELAPRPSGPQ